MARGVNKKSIRNLRQYQDMSDDEFEEIYQESITENESSKEFEERIEEKLLKLGEDYDLSDMKFNDKETLRALAQALITLEDLEQYTYRLRNDGEGLNDFNINLLDKTGRLMSSIRSDISNLQKDLNITRKSRKGDKEESVIAFIDDLKLKAKQFYQEKMSYVFCPKCNMLLGTVWVHYPDAKNKITFTCKRPLENEGEFCDTQVTVSTQELLEKRGTNKPEIMPESML